MATHAFVPWDGLAHVSAEGLTCLEWVVVERNATARRSPAKRDRAKLGCPVPPNESSVGDHFKRVQRRKGSNPDGTLFDQVLPGGWKNEALRRGE